MYEPFEIELHDSSILDCSLDRCLENLTLVVFAPFNEPERFIEFKFIAILRLEFESHLALVGNRISNLGISSLSRHKDALEERFSDRIKELEEEPETKRESKDLGFDEVFHISIDSDVVHRGFGPNSGLNGIHLVCRKIVAAPADKKWHASATPPTGIPGSPLDDISTN